MREASFAPLFWNLQPTQLSISVTCRTQNGTMTDGRFSWSFTEN